MEGTIFQRFRQGLEEKRDILRTWLQTTPEEAKLTQLGSLDENSVERYIARIDGTIAAAASEELGTCRVCHDHVELDLLEMDYTACVCLDHLSTTERRELENELELAQSVQKTLLPQEIPSIPGLEIAAFSRPAQYVGGDYFDFFEFQEDKSGLAIADVAGHGMSASLHMASVQTLLRSLALSDLSPADVVRKIQELFRHNIRFNTFVTLLLATYDHRDRSLTYCNAGHNPAMVWRKDGSGADRVDWLEPTGPAVGLLEDADFTNGATRLTPGDILLLYTDGIIEAQDSTDLEFGYERLVNLVERGSDLSAKELVRTIRIAVEEYVADGLFLDDLTLIVCKVS